MSRNLELSQLAKTLTVNADGTVTGLNIDASNIDGIPNTDLNIAPEILEIQVSAPQAGQDTAWLWTWLTSSLPYARREITNSPEIQVPLYKQGTYTVNNYAAYDLFDDMTQTHSLYLKWIDGAGTDNLISWATSTGPVSDSHPDINGGNATDVQRISISVPSTITLPTLTAPNVSYTVVNNGAGAYTFSGAAKGDNPNLGPFYRGGTYTVNITATGHPFYFTTDNGTNFSSGTYFGEYTDGVTGSRTDSGTITFTVPQDAPDTLYYQCGNHGVMRGAIIIRDLEVEVNNNGNYVVYFQHTQEGHKTPVELRPIPSLVNQMCLVYDASAGAFVPQDLATYVENTPSFENKIREVAGTAELVVEDGSAVVAKVNVYADSTYLPLVGNNAGDQAFATDTNKLYIWDGSAWQLAGAANTDELGEGNTNLYYTDSRVGTYLSSNGYDTATNIIASITDSAPTTLDTLNELAAALGDDPNFATTVSTQIGTKLSTSDFTSTADTWLATKDTDDVAEGSNQYFTTARVQGTAITSGSLRGTINNATVQYGTAYSGTPVQGSFFFDSLGSKLKIYTGSAFVDAVPAGTGGGEGGGETAANATFRKYTYSVTSGTNAVSGADDNAETLSYVTDGTQNVEVYRNGVKQVEGASNDYVASTGTSVNFTYNLSSGDVVDVQVYELLTNDAFYLKSETYTQTEVNNQIATGVSGYLPLGGGTTTGTVTVGKAGNGIFNVYRSNATSGTGYFGINVETNSQTTLAYDSGSQLVIGRSGDPSTQAGFNNDVIIDGGGSVVVNNRLFVSPGGVGYNGNTIGDSTAAVEIYPENSNKSGLMIANESGTAHTWFAYTDGNNYITADTSNTAGRNYLRRFDGSSYIDDLVIDTDGTVKIRSFIELTTAATTASQLPSSASAGSIAYVTDNGGSIFYKNSTSWVPINNALGGYGNPAINGQQLQSAGYSSGYYWIDPTGSLKRYCYVDMDHYGGAWVLVQVVGKDTNYHWAQTGDYNLYSTTDDAGFTAETVRFSGTGYSNTTGRRFSDAFVKAVGGSSGAEGVFRVEIAQNGGTTTNDTTLSGSADYKVCQFIRYDNGISYYNSSNNGGMSSKSDYAIDIAHYYPYSSNWETGGAGHYMLSNSAYKVFDGHSDPSSISTSLYSTVRFLWGYTGGAGSGYSAGNGIYGGSSTYAYYGNGSNNPGYMWIK